MTFQISDELLNTMVDGLLKTQGKRAYDVPFTLTNTRVQEYPTEIICLTVSLVVSGETHYKSLPSEKV